MFKVSPGIRGLPSERYLASLRTSFEPLRTTREDDPSHAAVAAEIARLFEAPDTQNPWESGYKIDSLMVTLLSGETLRTELARRAAEAKRCGASFSAFYEDRIAAEQLSEPDLKDGNRKDEQRRAVLSRLIDDLHWFYTENYVRRAYGRMAARRVTLVFLLALVAFVGLIWFTSRNVQLREPEPVAQGQDAAAPETEPATPSPTTTETDTAPQGD